MWEIIESNKRKSLILFIAMGVCLVLLGYFIGRFFSPDGGILGIFIAAGIWCVLSILSYFAGDHIVLATSNAKEVSYDVHPQLFNIVEEMKIAANFPYMPKIYIIDDLAPNAFATGIKPEKSSIAVTAGMLSMLNRDELQGVVAHEMSHIVNRDVLFVTFAGVLLGSITLISETFLRGIIYAPRSSRRYKSDKGGGQAQLFIILAAILFAILAPILARLLYFAISRKREYLADASAVRLTRYPEGLASALEKISSGNFNLENVNSVTAPMYIINPMEKNGLRLSDLSSTHPPISERIHILRSIMYGASFQHYQKAFSDVKKITVKIIPGSALTEETVPIRAASVDSKPVADKKEEARNLGDLMMAVNKYVFLTCVCGLKIKIPPDFGKPKIQCPRCNCELEVPSAKDNNEPAGVYTASPEYIRQGNRWETFSCSCGALQQISPAFSASHLTCKVCGKAIQIKNQ
ncbi:MAG: M48 family metallopeptidase [bacterium]|nr:M48 family metallopeptidase [bacterium]